MTGKKLSKILIPLFLLFGQLLQADMLYDASLLEREGKTEEALLLYKLWLSENTKNPDFSKILNYCSSVIPTVSGSIEILLKYESFVENEKKQDLYLRIAQIYELIFQNFKAKEYYKKAAYNRDGSINYNYYLKYLYLDYQQGNIPSMDLINNILLSESDSTVYVSALIFKAELLKYEGDLDGAISILHQSEYLEKSSELQFALREIHLIGGNDSAAAYILRDLRTKYPDSVELAMMEGHIGEIPRLSEFFIGQSEPEDNSLPLIEKSYVQVGSFSKKENAVQLSERLGSYNFEFFYETVENITKVIVFDAVPREVLLSRLQERGFDGFTIDYH